MNRPTPHDPPSSGSLSVVSAHQPSCDIPANPASENGRLDLDEVVARLSEAGYELPQLRPPAHAYLPGTTGGDFVYISGQTPKVDGDLMFHGICGRDVDVEQAQRAVELCTVNALAVLQATSGLARVESLIKVTVFVASTPDFTDHAHIAEAASLLLGRALGPRGWHTRSAIGVASLPGGAPVELELTAHCFAEERK